MPASSARSCRRGGSTGRRPSPDRVRRRCRCCRWRRRPVRAPQRACTHRFAERTHPALSQRRRRLACNRTPGAFETRALLIMRERRPIVGVRAGANRAQGFVGRGGWTPPLMSTAVRSIVDRTERRPRFAYQRGTYAPAAVSRTTASAAATGATRRGNERTCSLEFTGARRGGARNAERSARAVDPRCRRSRRAARRRREPNAARRTRARRKARDRPSHRVPCTVVRSGVRDACRRVAA